MTSTTEKLKSNLQDIALDIEELLRATADHGNEKVNAARDRVEHTLRHARAAAQDLGQAATERAKQAAYDADHYVHDHPWTVVGIGAGVGFLVGYLLARR